MSHFYFVQKYINYSLPRCCRILYCGRPDQLDAINISLGLPGWSAAWNVSTYPSPIDLPRSFGVVDSCNKCIKKVLKMSINPPIQKSLKNIAKKIVFIKKPRPKIKTKIQRIFKKKMSRVKFINLSINFLKYIRTRGTPHILFISKNYKNNFVLTFLIQNQMAVDFEVSLVWIFKISL